MEDPGEKQLKSKLSLIDDGLAPQAKLGDGGQVNHHLAEAALERRGNKAMREDLEGQNRHFDSNDQKGWETKYKYFSGKHMSDTYRNFAQARHDPFNKDPAWGKSMIAKVANACQRNGVTPKELFRDCDKTGDGNLCRAEMKKVLLSVAPKLSDLEITGIFDAVDHDSSGEVSIREFCQALEKSLKGPPIRQEDADRYKNPVHRIQRFAPAVDGIDAYPLASQGLSERELVDTAQRGMMQRLAGTILNTPRVDLTDRQHQYQYFAGGADVSRFRRHEADSKSRQKTPRGQQQAPPSGGSASTAPRGLSTTGSGLRSARGSGVGGQPCALEGGLVSYLSSGLDNSSQGGLVWDAKKLKKVQPSL